MEPASTPYRRFTPRSKSLTGSFFSSIMSYMQSSGAKQVARFQDHHQLVLGPDGQAKIGPCETSKDRSTLVDGKVAGAKCDPPHPRAVVSITKGPGHKYYKSLATTKNGCWQDELRTSGPVCASSGGAATAAPPAEEAAGGVIISNKKDWYQNARVQSKQVRYSGCCMPREGNDIALCM